MNTKNLIIIGLLGIGGYFLYNQFARPKRFFLLPNGMRIPEDQAAAILPSMGYVNTPYGWMNISALQQLQQASGNGGFNLGQFVNNIPQIWGSVQNFLDTWRDLFGNNADDLILGDPGGDFSDIAGVNIGEKKTPFVNTIENFKGEVIDSESYDTRAEAKKGARRMMKKYNLMRHAGHVINYRDQVELWTNY